MWNYVYKRFFRLALHTQEKHIFHLCIRGAIKCSFFFTEEKHWNKLSLTTPVDVWVGSFQPEYVITVPLWLKKWKKVKNKCPGLEKELCPETRSEQNMTLGRVWTLSRVTGKSLVNQKLHNMPHQTQGVLHPFGFLSMFQYCYRCDHIMPWVAGCSLLSPKVS